MPLDSSSLQVQYQDALTPLYVLGPTDHGGWGWWILWKLVQGVLRHDARQPLVIHDLQHGPGCRHPPMGDIGESIRGRHGGLGLKIIELEAYFYADDGLIVSTQPERLQRVFDVLTSIFDRVNL